MFYMKFCFELKKYINCCSLFRKRFSNKIHPIDNEIVQHKWTYENEKCNKIKKEYDFCILNDYEFQIR